MFLGIKGGIRWECKRTAVSREDAKRAEGEMLG